MFLKLVIHIILNTESEHILGFGKSWNHSFRIWMFPKLVIPFWTYHSDKFWEIRHARVWIIWKFPNFVITPPHEGSRCLSIIPGNSWKALSSHPLSEVKLCGCAFARMNKTKKRTAGTSFFYRTKYQNYGQWEIGEYRWFLGFINFQHYVATQRNFSTSENPKLRHATRVFQDLENSDHLATEQFEEFRNPI